MFEHLLVATDGSPLAQRGAHQAVELAKSLSARLTAVTVSAPFHRFGTDAKVAKNGEDVYNEQCARSADSYLAAIKKDAESSGVSFEGRHAFHDDPYVAIIDVAETNGCDVICVASHGRRGLEAILLGSETVNVLTHTKMPVIVWR